MFPNLQGGTYSLHKISLCATSGLWWMITSKKPQKFYNIKWGRVLTRGHLVPWLLLNPVCTDINEELQQFMSVEKVTNTKTAVQFNSTETDMAQISPSDTWIVRIYLKQTLSLCILLILALLHIIRECWHAAQLGQRFLTEHKVLDFVTKKSTLVSKYPVMATSDAVSVDPLLLFQQLITVGYRCAEIWAMCLSSSNIWDYWHHAAIQQSISSKCHTGMSTTFKNSNHPGCQLHLRRRCSDPQNSIENLLATVWKVCWVSPQRIMTRQRLVWWLPRWSSHKIKLPSAMEEIIWQ